jgi:hypothetical protein
MAPPSRTDTTDVSSANVYLYPEVVRQAVTKSDAEQPPPNYKKGEALPSLTGTEETQPHQIRSATDSGRAPSLLVATNESTERRFRGVVDQAEGSTSHVTLSYGGRDNAFLFPTSLLESAGANYAGALFEIVLKKEIGLHSYDIVHLTEEEDRARAENSHLDLSFLDGIKVTRRTNRR